MRMPVSALGSRCRPVAWCVRANRTRSSPSPCPTASPAALLLSTACPDGQGVYSAYCTSSTVSTEATTTHRSRRGGSCPHQSCRRDGARRCKPSCSNRAQWFFAQPCRVCWLFCLHVKWSCTQPCRDILLYTLIL